MSEITIKERLKLTWFEFLPISLRRPRAMGRYRGHFLDLEILREKWPLQSHRTRNLIECEVGGTSRRDRVPLFRTN